MSLHMRRPRAPHVDPRSGAFTLADSRGNNPHGTRETADREGRRRNAQRYETVGQLDAALDARAQAPTTAPTTSPGSVVRVPPPVSGGVDFLGALLLAAVGAVAYAIITAKDEPDDGEDGDDGYSDGEPTMVRENPGLPPAANPAANPAAPSVIVVPTPAPAPAVSAPPAPVTVTTTPRSKRRRKKTVVEVPAAAGATTVVLEPTSVVLGPSTKT